VIGWRVFLQAVKTREEVREMEGSITEAMCMTWVILGAIIVGILLMFVFPLLSTGTGEEQ